MMAKKRRRRRRRTVLHRDRERELRFLNEKDGHTTSIQKLCLSITTDQSYTIKALLVIVNYKQICSYIVSTALGWSLFGVFVALL